MSEQEDKRLIEEFLAGNEAAYNMLARKYRSRIYWHARRMVGNHEDADEVAQETLIAIYQKVKDFKALSSFSTWVYKITSSRSLNIIRKRKVKNFVTLDFLKDKQNREDIIKNFEDKEKLNEVEKKLMKLPDKQREVFVLRHFEELSYNEISEITGQAIGTLKANYFHALKKIVKENGDEK